MATIVNIETSSKKCSVALSKDGVVELELEDSKPMNHAECLALFIEKCLALAKRKGYPIDAIAVSLGPGSYTGLRIGLSMAKGLAFSLDIPLIGISTLQILTVKAMFRNMLWEGDEIIVSMIDARRMEVFSGGYDFSLKEIIKEAPVILDKDSFSMLYSKRKVIFIGEGIEKFKSLYGGDNAVWLDNLSPHARDMIALSERAYRDNNFIDIAYSIPNYLKDYQGSIPKKIFTTKDK